MYKYLKSIKLSYLYLFYAFVFLPIFFVRFREFTIFYNNSKLFTQPIQYYYERIQNTRINKYNDKIYICMKRKIYLKYKDTIVKIFMFYLKFS